jgi:hypothetical protein
LFGLYLLLLLDDGLGASRRYGRDEIIPLGQPQARLGHV